MSALQIPSAPARPATPTPVGPPPPADASPNLRLVEQPARRSLAPTGPLQAWRRRVVAVLVLLAALALVAEAVSGPVAPATEMVPASAATVVVEPGQTLWDVAAEHAPADTGAASYVRQLAELNGISNGAVDAWQVLRLPS